MARNDVIHDNEEEPRTRVLNFLNNEDFKEIIWKITCVILTLRSIRKEEEFNDFSEVFDNWQRKILEFSNRPGSGSSLELYADRLNQLYWGPKRYKRNPSTVEGAHKALKQNKIVCFYGLGGVGKTALTQKLMYDG